MPGDLCSNIGQDKLYLDGELMQTCRSSLAELALWIFSNHYVSHKSQCYC